MSGWLAGIFLAWRLWVWLLPRLDVSAAGLYLQDLLGRLASGGHLNTWDLPAAPCLFPDLGLAWFCRNQQGDPLAAQRFYGLWLGLLAWAGLAWLLRSLWALSKAQSRVYAAMGLLLVLSLSQVGLNGWLFPAQHGTAWISAVGLWAWALQQKEKPVGWWGTLLWSAVAGLLAASDPWFGLWAALPLVLLMLRCRPKVWLRLAVATAVGVGLAYVLRQRLALQVASFASPPWDAVSAQAWPGLGEAWAWWVARLAPLWPLWLLSGLGLGLWLWPQEGRHSGPRVLLLSWLLVALSSALLALRLDLSGLAWAYPLMLPALLLPLLVAERWPEWSRAALLAPLLASLLLIPADSGRSAADQRLAQAAWLKQALPADLHYGWAAPAPARALRLVSQGNLVLAPVLTGKDGVQPQAWCGDRSLWSEGAALERPQMVLMDGLDEAVVLRRLGQPRQILEHDGSKLWIYPGPLTRSEHERTRL